MTTTYETLSTELTEGVLTVTLNRPDKLNAYNPAMQRDLLDLFGRVNADDEVRAVVVTGAGRAFCAGADISGGGEAFRVWNDGGADRAAERRRSGDSITLAIWDCLKPVIAAINGAAVGVGVTMTLPMDIRLAGERAKFGFVFAQRGIVLESASSWFLPRLVGIAQAAEWSLTGRVFGSDEALSSGLVHAVHPQDELLPAAMRIAQQIAEAAPVSASLNRQLLWQGLTFPHPLHSHIAESRAMFERGTSPDVVEGVASFLERRPAQCGQTVPADLPDVFADLPRAPDEPSEWSGTPGGD